MSYQIKDSGGTEIDYRANSPVFGTTINKRSTLKFKALGTAGSPAPLDRGEDVYVYDGASKLWGGTVEEYLETDLTENGTTTPEYNYLAIDFDEIASRLRVAASYENMTSGAIVEAIRTAYLDSEGVTAGSIATGAEIQKINFNYVSVASALDELAELSGYYWCIDKDKALCFRARDEVLAPFNLTSGNKPYTKLQILRTRSKYRNTQYVRAGYDLTASRVEVQVGDANKRAFVLEYEVGSPPTVRVDTGSGYASQTVGIVGVDTGKQWYYTVGSYIVSQDSGETLLSSAHKLEVTYQGRFPIIVKAEDADEIASRASVESGTGVYESVVDDAGINDDDIALNKALGLLDKYPLTETISYETSTSGLEAGMLQTITLSDHNLDGQYLIESVMARDRGNGTLVYSVKALSGQAIGGWSAFFKRLVESGQSYIIRDNEVLIILRNLKDSMTMQDAPSTATTAGNFVYDTAQYNLSDYA